MTRSFEIALVACAALAMTGCHRGSEPTADGTIVLRVGHFPNITHAQGVLGHSFTREGKGWFEARLGPRVTIEWYTYNAGPSAMEAIFADSLDMTYVGPNPALNAYTKSKGEELRILAGSAVGGAALVVPASEAEFKPESLRGKRIATPQLGNTQDVACRAWLQERGMKAGVQGGDVSVVPTANPDQLALFKTGDVQGVWTVEPWVSRLELEAQGQAVVEDREGITTILTSSVKMLREHRDLARSFVQAHRELTEWIVAHPEEAQARFLAELKAETTQAMPAELCKHAWSRLTFTTEISRAPLETFLTNASNVGFLGEKVDLARLIEAP